MARKKSDKENGEQLSLAEQLTELTRLQPEEVSSILSTFTLAGVEFTLVKDANGTCAYFLDKNKKTKAIDAGILANCIGMFFGDPSRASFVNNLTQERVEAKASKRKKDAKVPSFNRDILHEITQSLAWEHLQTSANLTTIEVSVLKEFLAKKGFLLKVLLNEKTQQPEGFYFSNSSDVAKTIETDTAGTLAGFIFPSKSASLFSRLNKKAVEKFDLETGQKVNFIVPIRGQLEPLIQEFSELLALPLKGGKTEKLRNQERLRFRAEVISFLKPILLPLGIEPTDAKELTREDFSEEEALDNAVQVNKFPNFDIIFNKIHSSAVDIEKISLMGLGKTTNRSEEYDFPFELTPYENVIGIVLVNNDATLRELKQAARTSNGQARRYHASNDTTFLTLSPALFSEWKRRGTPIADEEEKENFKAEATDKKKFDYFFADRGEITKIELVTYEPMRSRIGGTQLFLLVWYGDICQAEILDFGYSFDLAPWSQIFNHPTVSEGIIPFLQNKMIPRIRRVYRTDLIEKSISPGIVQKVFNKMESGGTLLLGKNDEDFLVMEAFHRLGEENFIQLLRDQSPAIFTHMVRRQKLRPFIAWLNEQNRILYDQKTIFNTMSITHAHQDHAVGSSFVRDEVTRIITAITRALLLVDHKHAHAWYVQDTIRRKMREGKKIGSAWPVFDYPNILANHLERIQVSPNVYITPIHVLHSIPGCVSFYIEIVENGKTLTTIYYGGDYKNGEGFRTAAELGHINLAIVEGTNSPGQEGKKDSTRNADDDVERNLDNTVARANETGKALIIDTVKNSFRVLNDLIKIAQARGRTLVLSAKIIEGIRHIQMTTKVYAEELSHDLALPLISSKDPRIAVWKPDKATYSSADNDAFDNFRPITPNDISLNPSAYIVVRLNEQMEKLSGIGSEVMFIDMEYGAHDLAAKQNKRFREDFIKNVLEGEYMSKGFRSSGHTALDGDLLDDIAYSNPDEIAITHTLERGKVAEVFRNHPGFRDTIIHDRIGHDFHSYVLYEKTR